MNGFLQNNVNGRLCNQLYVLLQCNRLGLKMIPSKTCIDMDYIDVFKRIGLKQLIDDRDVEIIKKENPDCRIYHNSPYPQMRFGIDFSFRELNDFCKIISNSTEANLIPSIKNNDTSIAVHIRNTDYLNQHYIFFDRFKYLKYCLLEKRKDISHIDDIFVFSDDNTVSKAEYDSLFKQFSRNVVYISGNTAIYDLLYLSKFKHKILLNTTYSFWAGFIGDSINTNCFDKVFVPAYFDMIDKSRYLLGVKVNPLWRLVYV